ncbi:hypothetical protein BHM03_00026815 [Ensete ventricosum]|nr:hypothetical protein BHM03_00026815 [Ensete ventricosum]
MRLVYGTFVLSFLLLILRMPAGEALRSVSDGTDLRTDLPDATVELNSSNFDRVLKESPASFAIVEFFAHW